MAFTNASKHQTDAIVALFRATFADSEGADEGELIGSLVAELLTATADKDIFVFSNHKEGELVGSVVFTRLNFPEDERAVFLLSPLAVATSQQGRGVGQKLLNNALNSLKNSGVDVVITYGDINFYSKAGFVQISEDMARPPLSLSYPHGWLGQSLTQQPLTALKGPSFCVRALNNQAYW